MLEPRTSAIRSGATPASRACAHASRAASTANSTQYCHASEAAGVLRSGTIPASGTPNPLGSKRRIGAMPSHPSAIADHSRPIPRPTDDTAPSPVITAVTASPPSRR